MSTFLFVARRMMDLDHHLPVVYALLAAGHRVHFHTLPDVDLPGHPAFRLLAGSLVAGPLDAALYGGLLGPLRRRTGVRSAASRLLRRIGVDAVCLDWQKAQPPGAEIARAARSLGLPTVALPHGVDTVLDPAYLAEVPTYDEFDWVVTPSEIRRRTLVTKGLPPDRVKALGSARYDAAWCTRLSEVLPPELRSADFSVLYLDEEGPDEAARAIGGLIARLCDADMAVRYKAKPRKNLADRMQFFTDPRMTVKDHANTAGLIRSADAVLAASTSAALEAIVLRLPFIWLKFADEWPDNAYERMNACWVAASPAEAYDVLAGLKAGKLPPCPDEAARAAFVRHVLGGDSDTPALERHADFLESVAAGRQPT